MNIENFKSIVLINLIVISLFLTFNLWTYVPESNSSSDAKYVQGTEITNKKLSDVILPSSVIVKKNNKDNIHFVVQDEKYINELYEVLKEGEFHDFREIGKEKHEFLSFVNDEDKIEIVFPTDVPFDSIRSAFNLKEKKLEGYSFNRILIDLAASMDDDIKTYFVSDESKKIYEMTLKGVPLPQITGRVQAMLPNARPYYNPGLEGARVFLPNTETKMNESRYYVRPNIDESTFKNVLFTDPRYVKEIKGETENTYTDGIRLMKVLKENKMLQYTNSSVEDNERIYGNTNTPVQRSFDFINSHNGFPDNYRFDYMNAEEGKITFRSYMNNLPIFNADGMSKLEQVWGAADLISYQRPLFDLVHMQGYEKGVTLPRGLEVFTSLQNNSQISMKKVKDIGIGYKLIPEAETFGGDSVATVRLKPIWYVVYGENHQVFEWSAEEGGKLIGLE